MNMHLIDWAIVVVFFAYLTWLAIHTRKYVRSVADFLACNRCADRYLLSISIGLASLGVLSLMAFFEMNYSAGFPPLWWGFMISPLYFLVTLSGFVVYRYRQTRALTLGQFYEIRYSRPFRIFTGILGYLSGLLAFGITPGLGTNFIMNYCGLPRHFTLLGMPCSTFAVTMFVLMVVALFFTYIGGQVSVIITDFAQGMFCNIIFMIILLACLFLFDWSKVVSGLKMAPLDASLLNPFSTGGVKDFNIYYSLVAGFGFFYNAIGASGGGGYSGAARTPHEARMGSIMAIWRAMALNGVLVVLPITAYAIMHEPAYSGLAGKANQLLATVADPQVRKQLTVPVVTSIILPRGLVGAFCAVILAAFVAMTNTSLHAFGSMFIQDIILPFRKKPFAPSQHIKILRWSILGVAVFVFLWSLLIPVKGFIFMFIAIVMAIAGGSGAVIIGGLYWKRGTTRAAWGAMLTGAVLALIGFYLQQSYDNFPINGQVMSFICWMAAIGVYFGLSMFEGGVLKRPMFNMDRMLHRGAYALKDDNAEHLNQPFQLSKWRQVIDMGKEFTFFDKVIYLGTMVWATSWFIGFVVGSLLALAGKLSDDNWATFWHVYVLIYTVLGVVTTVWFLLGGTRDIINMLRRLNSMERNAADDGSVVGHQSRTEVEGARQPVAPSGSAESAEAEISKATLPSSAPPGSRPK